MEPSTLTKTKDKAAEKARSEPLRKRKRLENIKAIDGFRKMYDNETLRNQMIFNIKLIAVDTGFKETVMCMSPAAEILTRMTPYLSFVYPVW